MREFLQFRHELGSTVPGICSFHMFKPMNVGVISYKTTAKDDNFSRTFYFFDGPASNKPLQSKIHDYVAVFFDEHLWMGVIITCDQVAKVLQDKFITLHGARRAYLWPNKVGLCWIQAQNEIRILRTLCAAFLFGCMFKLNEEDFLSLSTLK